MIGSFRDGWLEDWFENGTAARRVPADLQARLFRKLQLIDDAVSDRDLRVPPGNHFEKLSGHLADYHSIRRLSFDQGQPAVAARLPMACING
jgi:toxin HigB-1